MLSYGEHLQGHALSDEILGLQCYSQKTVTQQNGGHCLYASSGDEISPS